MKVKLSEMYTVYWEYVEKTRRFIQERGNSAFEEGAVATIKSIMKHYMGEPPSEILVDGKKMSPLQYLHDVIRINPDDYVDILSYEQEPFYKHVEYKVPDNWWHSTDYCNVPLNIFMETLKKVVRNGY